MGAQVGVLLNKLEGIRHSGAGWTARCPAHEDKDPSLSISVDGDRVLLHCHAGCESSDVLAAVGLTWADLVSDGDRRPTKERYQSAEILATYEYTDIEGKVLYEVVRSEGKKFLQRRPDGKGGFVWNLDGIQRVLYRLPTLRPSIERGNTIYIPEGEKDVHTLESLDLTATCNSGGAGKWRDSYSDILRGASVVILPDNDKPGHDHAEAVAQSLHGIAESVRIVELPGLKPKQDVTDWVNAGGTAEGLRRLVQETPEWQPGASTEAAITDDYPRTDLGNGERLIAPHGADIRYVPHWKKWIIWDGIRWAIDETLGIERRAKDTVRSIYAEASREEDKGTRKAIADWAKRSESADRIGAMIRLAQSQVTITPGELDTDPYLLCCTNGILDLRTGELATPRRENYITKQIPVAYDPKAECPIWNKFLERVLPQPELRDYVQKAVGYTLTADVSEQCLFFLFGEGRNGKTTFMEILSELLGDYFAKSQSETLMVKRFGSGIPNDVAALAGARLVTTSEISSGQRFNEGLVKDLTGGDTITARFLHAEYFFFRAGFKLWLYGNQKPTIRGKDEGIWRRVRLIPFTVVIPKRECDLHLADKLKSELPGILRWAIEGCLRWQAEGLAEPDAILDAVNEYKREQDALGDFLAEHCLFGRGLTTTKKELWQAYRQWAADSDEEAYETQRKFNEEIGGHPGTKSARGNANVSIWRGIGLKMGGVNQVNLVTDFTCFPPHEELEEEISCKIGKLINFDTSHAQISDDPDGVDDPTPDQCSVCGAPVARYLADGTAFCDVHYPQGDSLI